MLREARKSAYSGLDFKFDISCFLRLKGENYLSTIDAHIAVDALFVVLSVTAYRNFTLCRKSAHFS